MNLRPYYQGRLDAMCAIYAVINAARIASWPTPRLTNDDSFDLFSELVAELATTGRLLEVVTEGSTNGVMGKLLRAASAWLRDNYNARLSYHRPFKHGAERGRRSFVDHLAKHLIEPHTAAIVALNGDPGHWTVVRTVTTKGSLVLFDSDDRTFVRFGSTRNSSLQLRLSPRDLYLISAHRKN